MLKKPTRVTEITLLFYRYVHIIRQYQYGLLYGISALSYLPWKLLLGAYLPLAGRQQICARIPQLAAADS